MWCCDVGPGRDRRVAVIFAALTVLPLLLSASLPAQAGTLIDEIRLGASKHNIEPRGQDVEYGLELNAEVLFAPVTSKTGNTWLDALFTFRPSIGVDYSASGNTSMLFGDLNWEKKLGNGLFYEIGFGAAVHDGALVNASPLEIRAEFGCRVNFHQSASLGYDIDEHWRALLTVDHMSNARLCAVNTGLTHGGLRLGYHFD